jgi:polysaccharide biosynthesis protein PslG
MAHFWFRRVLCLAVLLSSLVFVPGVQAARGIPGSPEFGIGVSLDYTRSDLSEALNLMTGLTPDWLRIEVRWDAYEPEPGFQPDWSTLDMTLQNAAALNIPALVSLTAAPSWALTEQGPEREAVSRFVLALIGRYPGTLQAIELFPSANTISGWQAQPDPANYGYLIQSVQSSLSEAGSPVWIVAGGLVPCSPDADALEFLNGLYASNGRAFLRIISLNYQEVNGSPHDPPDACQNLRYYERVREVMAANQHIDGKIWITNMNLPGGLSSGDQVNWLNNAYPQIRSQLYVGAAFLQGLNVTPAGALPLLQPEGGLHEYTSTLKSFIDENRALGQPVKPGRQKSAIFAKNKP